MATRRTPGAALSALPAAPVPRPPHPTRPMRISSLPAAYAPVSRSRPDATEPTTAALVAVRMKSRRVTPAAEAFSVFMDSPLPVEPFGLAEPPQNSANGGHGPSTAGTVQRLH